MKKLLFLMIVACMMMSCRSVKNEGYTHRYITDMDSLESVVKSTLTDSVDYYHEVIDSLAKELSHARLMYRDLYVRDSINENRYRSDSVHVTDSSWMEINADGSVSHYKYREKNTYSHQELERYRQQIKNESQAIIDSLIERTEHLQAQSDRLLKYVTIADSAYIYKSKLDSLSQTSVEQQTIKKTNLFEVIRAVVYLCSLIFLIFLIYRFYKVVS